MSVKEVLMAAGKAVGKNSPHILTAVGVCSFVTATVMAAKAAPAAKPAYDQAKRKYYDMTAHGYSQTEATVELVQDIAKDVAPLYLGTAGLMVLGTVCVIAADRVHIKRQTALMAAYTVSEKALDIYQNKVIERLGQGKHEAVLDDIAEDDCPFDEDVDPSKIEIIEEEGVLCFDHVTGRYFKSSIEDIRKAEARIVKRIIDETMVPLNELYYELGLEDVSLVGDVLGWDVGRVKPDIHFTSMLDKNGVPCLVLNYRTCIVNSSML